MEAQATSKRTHHVVVQGAERRTHVGFRERAACLDVVLECTVRLRFARKEVYILLFLSLTFGILDAVNFVLDTHSCVFRLDY